MIQVRYRKLFVGGIDSDITENDLKAYFERFGTLTGCTIHRNRETGRSRGFGFVTFKEASSVDEVQNTRPHTIKDCEVTTKRAVPRELFQVFDGLLTVNKIFVGGLSQEVEEAELRDYFGSFGRVRRIDIMVDRNTNTMRGFAFVEFDDYDPVDKVVLQVSHIIHGQDVTVRKAKSRLEMELIRSQTGVDPKSVTPRRRPVSAFEQRPVPFGLPINAFARSSLDSFDCPFHIDSRRRGRFC